jgi:hypothetical protein
MMKKPVKTKAPAEQVVKDIRRACYIRPGRRSGSFCPDFVAKTALPSFVGQPKLNNSIET